jgi:hypothetical protein
MTAPPTPDEMRLRGAAKLTHGMRKRPEYRAWLNMKARCYDPKREDFRLYGARGIAVCDQWRNDFAAFYADLGARPSPEHSLDRIDGSGNYEPGNCHWATKTEQSENRRISRFLELNGRRQTMEAWARELGMVATGIAYRLQHGWSLERALTEPPKKRRRERTDVHA